LTIFHDLKISPRFFTTLPNHKKPHKNKHLQPLPPYPTTIFNLGMKIALTNRQNLPKGISPRALLVKRSNQMKQTQQIQVVVITDKPSLKQKLVAKFRRHKQTTFKAKLHRYRAITSAQAA